MQAPGSGSAHVTVVGSRVLAPSLLRASVHPLGGERADAYLRTLLLDLSDRRHANAWSVLDVLTYFLFWRRYFALGEKSP